MVDSTKRQIALQTGGQKLPRNIVQQVIQVVLTLGIIGIMCETALADDPVLVRFVTRGDTSTESVAGVLLDDNDREVTILDLETLQERIFSTRSMSSVKNPATDQEVASLVGLAPITSWFISESLPSRPESGRVASVDGAVSYINLGEQAGISDGEKLNVFRGEQEIVDPETGEVLGTTRRRIAQVEVIDVMNRLSKVRLLSEFEIELEVGDQVRPVSAENPVAVLPFGRSGGQLIEGGVQLAEEVTTYLIKNDVTVVERTLLEEALAELRLGQTAEFDPDTARRVGELLQAYAVVAGTIQVDGRDADVNVRLIEVETGRILYATSLTVRGLNLSRTTSRTSSPAQTSQELASTESDLEEAGFLKIAELDGHTDQIRCVAFSPDGTMAATGSADRTVRLWRIDGSIRVRVLRGHAGTVNCVAITRDGQTVVSGSYDGTVRLWDTGSGVEVHRFRLNQDVRDLAISGNDNQIATAIRGSDSGAIQLCYIESRQTGRRFVSDSPVWSVDISPDQQWIASGGTDGRVELRQQHTRQLRTLGWHSGRVNCVRFSHDGNLLVSTGTDDQVQIWNVHTGQSVTRVSAAGSYGDVLLTDDGDFCVSSGAELQFRRLPTGEPIHSFRWPGTRLAANAKKSLVALTVGEEVELWSLPADVYGTEHTE